MRHFFPFFICTTFETRSEIFWYKGNSFWRNPSTSLMFEKKIPDITGSAFRSKILKRWALKKKIKIKNLKKNSEKSYIDKFKGFRRTESYAKLRTIFTSKLSIPKRNPIDLLANHETIFWRWVRTLDTHDFSRVLLDRRKWHKN